MGEEGKMKNANLGFYFDALQPNFDGIVWS